ncbi:acetoin utilization AcuB family protein [Falsibacillus pallidus]|uniref:Acetoin utilization protein AcuB n=1 Tax=Falsibacillus pallidus TaxID=493781 RepID=A0A370GKU5_9BACI|nr:acetoin utilization AcuB family protein [Falsibacillus pallidus]RDI44301.1 acetoin utilization protein AcuB [Falsibacillus pallidus]
MIIEQIMKTHVETLTPQHTLKSAIELMRAKKIRHIPIVNENNEVVGLVTDRDVKDAAPSIFEENGSREEFAAPLQRIMQKDIITGHPLDFVEEAASLFYEHHIGCMPITRDKKLVGIITETDLLYTLVELTGGNQPGSQIEVKVPNKAGMLSEVAGIISSHKANVHSVLVYPDKENSEHKILVFRVGTMNPVNVINALKSEGHVVLWPNMPGMPS